MSNKTLQFTATVANDDNAGLIFTSPASELGGRRYFKGKNIKVTYELDKEEHSYLQRGYYHAVIVKEYWNCLRDDGETYDLKQVHELLKLMFNPVYIYDKKTGEIKHILPGSTKNLKTNEFFDVMVEPARQMMAERYGVNVPDPDKNKYAQQLERERMAEERRLKREMKKSVA